MVHCKLLQLILALWDRMRWSGWRRTLLNILCVPVFLWNWNLTYVLCSKAFIEKIILKLETLVLWRLSQILNASDVWNFIPLMSYYFILELCKPFHGIWNINQVKYTCTSIYLMLRSWLIQKKWRKWLTRSKTERLRKRKMFSKDRFMFYDSPYIQYPRKVLMMTLQ